MIIIIIVELSKMSKLRKILNRNVLAKLQLCFLVIIVIIVIIGNEMLEVILI